MRFPPQWNGTFVDDVSRAYSPYLLVLLVGLALIAALPGLTLVLPRAILGYRG